jgi:hypothetical protein
MTWTDCSSGCEATAGSGAVAGGPTGSSWELARTARSRTVASTAMPTAITALMAAVTCNPMVNASRAAVISAVPTSVGSCWATATAPPRVSRAAAAAWPGTSAGRVVAS